MTTLTEEREEIVPRSSLFQVLNENPTLRVVGGWLLLFGIVLADLLTGSSIRLAPLYCLPVIALSYEPKPARGILVAVVAGLAWAVMGSGLVEVFIYGRFVDIVERLPFTVLIWLFGTIGFSIVALGFHTIRAQQQAIELAERKRTHREKELLNAISSTIHHEINNPLAVIAAQADLMKLENADAKTVQSILSIQGAVNRISQFVREIAALEEVRLKNYGTNNQLLDLKPTEHSEPASKS
jgi:signal transduction histidine kinase